MKKETDLESIQYDIISREAYRVIANEWKTIQEQFLSILPPVSSRAYRLIDRKPEIEDLVLKLEKDIPPNDLGNWPDTTPADYRDILNASWVFKIRKIKEDSNWGTADDLEKTLYTSPMSRPKLGIF